MKGFIYLTIGLFFFSCGQSSPETETKKNDNVNNQNSEKSELEDSTFTFIEWMDFKLDSTVKPDKKIEFEGYLGYSKSTFDAKSVQFRLPFYPRRGQSAGFFVNVKLDIGGDINQIVKVNSASGVSTLGILDANLDTIKPGDYCLIKATKEFGNFKNLSVEGISVNKVDKTVEKEQFTSAVQLTQALIDDSLQSSTYCYMTGKLELTDFQLLEKAYILTFNQKDNSTVKSVMLSVGKEYSCALELPIEYKNSDFKIKDYKGKTIPGTSRIKIYGQFERNPIKGPNIPKGTFHLEEIEAS